MATGPQEALSLLEQAGHETALLGGGAAVDDAFLRVGLVDELYLNVLPYLSGPALNVSLPDGEFVDARLLDATRLGMSVVQLHYEIGQS